MNDNRETRKKLMKDIQIATFAAVETNLYLDTHPYDTEALCALKEYDEMRAKAICEYERLYGPVFAFSTVGDSDKYKWVTEPFPWETED